MKNKLTVFDLKMHEIITLGEWSVMRVPGGWIYSHVDYNTVVHDQHAGNQNTMDTHSVFVPYSDAVKRDLLERVVHG